MHRSYLFAPKHNEKLLAKVFAANANAMMLNLKDAVPPDAKPRAGSERQRNCCGLYGRSGSADGITPK